MIRKRQRYLVHLIGGPEDGTSVAVKVQPPRSIRFVAGSDPHIEPVDRALDRLLGVPPLLGHYELDHRAFDEFFYHWRA